MTAEAEDSMDKATAERFVLDQVPLRYRALIPPVIKDAKAAVAILARSEPILQVESAKNNYGRLISWGVDLGIQRLIESGRWPADFRWRSFAKPTGKYLQLRLSHSVMSISLVADPAIQPRDVKFRQNARLNNQPSFDIEEFEDTRAVAGLPSFLLVHGTASKGDLVQEFAHIGVPHPEHHRKYIYRTANIMDLPHEVHSDVPPVEDTDDDAVMSMKEDIEKWRRDNGFE
jgi:hypothetical protein